MEDPFIVLFEELPKMIDPRVSANPVANPSAIASGCRQISAQSQTVPFSNSIA